MCSYIILSGLQHLITLNIVSLQQRRAQLAIFSPADGNVLAASEGVGVHVEVLWHGGEHLLGVDVPGSPVQSGLSWVGLIGVIQVHVCCRSQYHLEETWSGPG